LKCAVYIVFALLYRGLYSRLIIYNFIQRSRKLSVEMETSKAVTDNYDR